MVAIGEKGRQQASGACWRFNNREDAAVRLRQPPADRAAGSGGMRQGGNRKEGAALADAIWRSLKKKGWHFAEPALVSWLGTPVVVLRQQ